MRRALLLIGSGVEARHERLLADLCSRTEVVLLQPSEASWPRRHVAHAVALPDREVSTLVAAIRQLEERWRFEAVLTYEEDLIPLVGAVTSATEIPGLAESVCGVVRDKAAQRQAMARAGISPLRSSLVFDQGEAEAAAASIGYPVVIKPRNLSGSLGVRVVTEPAAFPRLYREAVAVTGRTTPRTSGCLIEEYLDGPEFCVDCWVVDGLAGPLFTARIEKAHSPHAINVAGIVGVGVAAADVTTTLEDVACRAAVACGLDRAIADVDLRWTPEGPRVLEVNGRPGGELLPHLAFLASGIRIGEVLADVVRGHVPAPRPLPVRAAGVAFLAPPHSMRFGELVTPPDLERSPWLLEVRASVERGAAVVPPPDDPWGRVGWAIAEGRDAAEVQARLDQLRRRIGVVPDAPLVTSHRSLEGPGGVGSVGTGEQVANPIGPDGQQQGR